MNVTMPSAQPPGYVRTADVISALSIASDLSFGLPAEHSARSCYIALAIARELGLATSAQGELYYTSLLLDAGCTAYASAFAEYLRGNETIARHELFFNRDSDSPLAILDWARHYLAGEAPLPVRAGRVMDFIFNGRELFRDGFRATCEVAHRFSGRLGMPPAVQHALLYVFEQWDGKGWPSQVHGDAIPIISRIAHVALFLEVTHREHSRDTALRLAQDRRGKAFDPLIVDAFRATAQRPDFWETLERESILSIVREMEPALPNRLIREEKLLDVALFAADFVDLKSRYALGHSRRVARAVEAIARRMALPEREIASVHLAALVHDLGLVALPAFVLEKPPDLLAPAEQEALRLHPYHGERILARVPVLRDVADIVGAHHERLDGQGYFRALSGEQIPPGARIIAVADRFDELTHDGPQRAALDATAAIAAIRDQVGHAFDHKVFAAFLAEATLEDGEARSTAPRRSWPAGLTQREVEVLRLAARGLTRKQMADRLFISPSTIRSHLEHIYAKIDVSSRAAAALFAIEHDLVA